MGKIANPEGMRNYTYLFTVSFHNYGKREIGKSTTIQNTVAGLVEHGLKVKENLRISPEVMLKEFYHGNV